MTEPMLCKPELFLSGGCANGAFEVAVLKAFTTARLLDAF
jgi:hypothetical protein